MKPTLVFFAAALVSGTASAQNAATPVCYEQGKEKVCLSTGDAAKLIKTQADELALQKVQIIDLRMAIISVQAQPIQNERNSAVKALEEANPGKVYNSQTGALQDIPKAAVVSQTGTSPKSSPVPVEPPKPINGPPASAK